MSYDEAIHFFGTQVQLAAALGITQSTVSLWKRVVPDNYQYQLEIITEGKLEVDPHLRHPKNVPALQQSAHSPRRDQQA